MKLNKPENNGVVTTVEQDTLDIPNPIYFEWEPTKEQLSTIDKMLSGELTIIVPTYHQGKKHFV